MPPESKYLPFLPNAAKLTLPKIPQTRIIVGFRGKGPMSVSQVRSRVDMNGFNHSPEERIRKVAECCTYGNNAGKPWNVPNRYSLV